MFEIVDTAVKELIFMSWPIIIVSVLVLVSLRTAYIIKTKSEFVFYKEILSLLFVVYTLCMFQVVTSQDLIGSGTSNYTLFSEITRYKLGSNLFLKQVIGNIILFAPYGYFISYYLKSEKIYVPIFMTLLLSLSIESIQLIIGRVFDIDDILLNIIGGGLGFCIYKTLDNAYDLLPNFLKSTWFLNLITTIGFILFIWYTCSVVI